VEAAPVTVLDALDNAVGERVRDGSLGQITVAELDEVRDVLTDFWNAQSDPNAPTDSDAPPPSFIGGWVGPFWSERMLRGDLSDALLYYPRLLVLDPLADFFSDGRGLPPLWRTRYRRPDGQVNVMTTGPDMWRDPFTYTTLRSNAVEAAHRFASIVENLYLLEQPIRGGVIIVRSQWPTLRAKQEQLATAVRHDSRNSILQEYLDETDRAELHLWDTIRGMQATMDLPVVKADAPMQYAPALYYLAKTLAVADATGAQYVPVNQASLGLLRAKYNDAVRSHPSAMLREVSRVVVPSSDIPIREAVAMRASSDDFEDWRLGLQSLQRASADDDLATLHDRVQETLLPRVHDVERGLQTSRLRESFTRAGADVIVDGAVGVLTGVATATQADLATAVLAGLGGAAGGATLRWMLRQYAPAGSSGAEAVLVTLIRAGQ
jgi:hypothetical protein